MYIKRTKFPYVALQVLLVLCGIWTLDFLRPAIPPFCLGSNIKTIYALALEYPIAFYPICMHKTPQQQLHTSCLAIYMEAISQTFCSPQEKMGL